MVIFLYGPDTYRSKQKLSALKQKFKYQKDKQGLSIAELSASAIDVDMLRKTVLSSGLFSQKRLTIIKGLFASLKKKEHIDALIQEAANIVRHIGDPPARLAKASAKRAGEASNILIFFDEEIDQKKLTNSQKQLYNALKNTKYAQEFKQLAPYQTKAWITKQIEKNNMSIDARAVDLLFDICGNNLWELNNELDKIIAALYKSQSTIRIKDIQKLVLVKTEQDIFKLVDAIGHKNKPLALKLLSDQLKGGASIDYLISMLAHQYRTILRIKTYIQKSNTTNSYAIARALSLHPFVGKKGLDQEKNYTLEELKKTYRKLLEIDFIRKTRSINPETLLDVLIATS
ncbi:DNA polymerase III subunit delta [Patescibacteria group bacterium AH-259-L07]|nr:DNA polymerase III subunit delta [Patescibacteria group bacterium AH-259-L07]